MVIRTRRDMATALQQRMNNAQARVGDRRITPDTSLIKTYLIEAHCTGSDTRPRPEAMMTQALAKPFSLQLGDTDEESLSILNGRVGDTPISLFVDSSDSRFWILHSVGASEASDRIVKAITQWPAFDRVWLPAPFLEALTSLGEFRGLRLSFDRRQGTQPTREAPAAADSDVAYLKMQLWGTRARDVLWLLREGAAFPGETTLSKVHLRYSFDTDESEVAPFVEQAINYHGKITARGTSFDAHVTMLSEVLRRYRDAIATVESRHRVSMSRTDRGGEVSGTPVYFSFSQPVEDVAAFAQRLFSPSRPFRLLGVPFAIKKDCVRLHAVDLHVNETLFCEVTPEFMRVFLPKHACGNTVMRLLTNMQHHIDARTTATHANGEPIFAF